jgi:hypothetical protein
MITKDVARLIYNCYSEIENGEKMIEELKKAIDENGDFVLVNSWGEQKRFLELSIPSKQGYSIKQVPIQLGIDAILAHIAANKRELKRLKTTCKTQLLDAKS